MTQSRTDSPLACPACGAQLASNASHCTRCGRTAAAGASTVVTTRTRSDVERRAIDRPWFVLALLFCVTAALGLPILWKSRGFSLIAKLLVSLLVTVYTVLLLWGFWLLMNWCVVRIMGAMA